MRYSLLSRFRGVLLGAAVGEVFGWYCQGRSPLQLQHKYLDINCIYQGKNSQKIEIQESEFHLKPLAVIYAESLIYNGNLINIDDSKINLLKTSGINSKINCNSNNFLATLPIMMYFHENTEKMQAKLEEFAKIEMIEASLALGFVIAQVLQEKVDRVRLIPEVISYFNEEILSKLGENQQYLILIQQLQQLQILLEHGASLEIIKNSLLRSTQISPNISAIIIALYCFLSTPEDWHLSVIRGARLGFAPQLTCGIIGALSGAYNSMAGIPLGWRLNFAKTDENEDLLKMLWGMRSTEEIIELSDRLLASWAGVYQLNNLPLDTNLLLFVAAPQVIKGY